MQVWSIQSLDVALGFVGGISWILWTVLEFCYDDFETFKFKNSLIGAIYPTTRFKIGEERPTPESEDQARNEMLHTVADRGRYFYNYS